MWAGSSVTRLLSNPVFEPGFIPSMYWTGHLYHSFPNYHPVIRLSLKAAPASPDSLGWAVCWWNRVVCSGRQGQARRMRPLGDGDNWSVSSDEGGISRRVLCAGGSTQVRHGAERRCNLEARLCPGAPHQLQPCITQPFLNKGKNCPSQSLPKALSRASPWGTPSLGVNKTYCDLSKCPLLCGIAMPLITASRSSDPGRARQLP